MYMEILFGETVVKRRIRTMAEGKTSHITHSKLAEEGTLGDS
jgi:hypothetical protein